MSVLKEYFQKLIDRVENSDLITNQGKDDAGFFKPTRTLLLGHLHKLRDLHGSSLAKPIVKDSWRFVVETLPPDWLVLTDVEKAQLKKMLS